MKNKKMSAGKMLTAGAGIAALGAGAYYFFGPKSKIHQKKALALANKMKKEVFSEIKKAEKVTLPIYHKAVDAISSNYAKQYNLHEKDVEAFAKKLKSEWKNISGKIAKKPTKKPAKKSKNKRA